MFELVIAWENGERTTYTHETREDAERAGEFIEWAYGDYIRWYFTRARRA